MWRLCEMQKIKRKLHNTEIVKRIHIYVHIIELFGSLIRPQTQWKQFYFDSKSHPMQCQNSTNFILNVVASDPGKVDYVVEPLGPLRNRLSPVA